MFKIIGERLSKYSAYLKDFFKDSNQTFQDEKWDDWTRKYPRWDSSRLDTSELKISELEDVETKMKYKVDTKKKRERKIKSVSGPWDALKMPDKIYF